MKLHNIQHSLKRFSQKTDDGKAKTFHEVELGYRNCNSQNCSCLQKITRHNNCDDFLIDFTLGISFIPK